MGLSHPTCPNKRGMLQTLSVKEFWLQPGKAFSAVVPSLHDFWGEIQIHPFGLPKGSVDLAVLTGMEAQWGHIILEVVNRPW